MDARSVCAFSLDIWAHTHTHHIPRVRRLVVPTQPSKWCPFSVYGSYSPSPPSKEGFLVSCLPSSAVHSSSRGRSQYSPMVRSDLEFNVSDFNTQRVHVGKWYILRAQRGSHIPTLRPKYIPYTYMDPLGYRSIRATDRGSEGLGRPPRVDLLELKVWVKRI